MPPSALFETAVSNKATAKIPAAHYRARCGSRLAVCPAIICCLAVSATTFVLGTGYGYRAVVFKVNHETIAYDGGFVVGDHFNVFFVEGNHNFSLCNSVLSLSDPCRVSSRNRTPDAIRAFL